MDDSTPSPQPEQVPGTLPQDERVALQSEIDHLRRVCHRLRIDNARLSRELAECRQPKLPI